MDMMTIFMKKVIYVVLIKNILFLLKKVQQFLEENGVTQSSMNQHGVKIYYYLA